MKLLFSLIILFISFFLSTAPVFAYDLEVQCTETKCTLSSKDALFPPSEKWTPHKTLEKEILIKNTDGNEKDVFLKILSDGSNGQLDPYVLITLANDMNTILWDGSLLELLDDETIHLATIPHGDAYLLSMTAQMDSNTPNTLQGESSAFNFGFGFEGDQTNSDENDESESNTSSSSVQTLVDQILTGAQTFLPTQTGGFPNILGDTNNVLAAASEEAKQKNDQNLQAGEKETCETNSYWPLILILETLLILFVLWKTKNQYKIPLSVATVLASSLVIFFLVCLKGYAAFALLPILFLPLKRSIKTNN